MQNTVVHWLSDYLLKKGINVIRAIHRLTVSLIAALIMLLQFSAPAAAGLFDNANPFASQNGPLEVEQAFVFAADQQQDKVQLIWTIPDGYYLYRIRLS